MGIAPCGPRIKPFVFLRNGGCCTENQKVCDKKKRKNSSDKLWGKVKGKGKGEGPHETSGTLRWVGANGSGLPNA